MRSNEIFSESVPAKKPLVPYVDTKESIAKKLIQVKAVISNKNQLVNYYNKEAATSKQRIEKIQKSLDALSKDPSANSEKIKLLKTKLKIENADLKEAINTPKDLETEIEDLKKQLLKIEQQLKQASQNAPIDPKLINRLVKQIQTNCQWYLNLMKQQKDYLYRGRSRDQSSLAFVSSTPTNRQPLDSEKGAIEIFDLLSAKLGITALRSNSIFTTSDLTLAKSYGEIYYIFPYNSASFTWSTKKNDIVINSDDVEPFVDYGFEEIAEVVNNELEKYDQFDLQGSLLKYHTLLKAFENNYYYYKSYDQLPEFRQSTLVEIQKLQPKSPLLPLLKKEPTYNLENFQRVYDLASDQVGYASAEESFVDALKSGHEILIHGKYIAVKQELWPYIKDLL